MYVIGWHACIRYIIRIFSGEKTKKQRETFFSQQVDRKESERERKRKEKQNRKLKLVVYQSISNQVLAINKSR